MSDEILQGPSAAPEEAYDDYSGPAAANESEGADSDYISLAGGTLGPAEASGFEVRDDDYAVSPEGPPDDPYPEYGDYYDAPVEAPADAVPVGAPCSYGGAVRGGYGRAPAPGSVEEVDEEDGGEPVVFAAEGPAGVTVGAAEDVYEYDDDVAYDDVVYDDVTSTPQPGPVTLMAGRDDELSETEYGDQISFAEQDMGGPVGGATLSVAFIMFFSLCNDFHLMYQPGFFQDP